MPAFTRRLAELRGIIWDLDGTLYQFEQHHEQAFAEAVAHAALKSGVKVEFNQAVQMGISSYLAHGFSGQVFVDQHGLDYDTFHQTYHQCIDETIITPSTRLVELFDHSDLGHVILTHGSADWALRAVRHLGLSDHFNRSNIIAFEDYAFRKKSVCDKSFMTALDRLDVAPSKALMVEDTFKNLSLPQRLGIGTVLLPPPDHDSKCLPPFVDRCYPNAVQLLTAVEQAKSFRQRSFAA